METPQQMPKITDLCEAQYTRRQWLIYYKNVWNRNLMARAIDVQTDRIKKAIDPEELVQTDTGNQVPVKERLEIRKMSVQEAVELMDGIDALLLLTDEEIDALFTKDALKVDEDMLAPSVGKPCTTGENENGRFEQSAPGKFVCVPLGKSVEDFLKEKVEADSKKPEEGGAPVPAEAK